MSSATIRSFVSLAISAGLSLFESGCNLYRRAVAPEPPSYSIYPAPALSVYKAGLTKVDSKGNEIPDEKAEKLWSVKDSTLPGRINEWHYYYEDAIGYYFQFWLPRKENLKDTLKLVAKEYDVNTEDLGPNLEEASWNFFYGPSGAEKNSRPYFRGVIDGDSLSRKAYLRDQVGIMIAFADRENKGLLVTEASRIKSWPTNKTFSLPIVLSQPDAVSVAVTPSWGISADAKSSDDSGKKPNQIVLDKLGIVIQAAPDPAAQKSSIAPQSSDSTDFQEDQTVTLNVSTALNSASVLDRIQYVTTYIYLAPWQRTTNGEVNLEKEFWRNFFECYSLHVRASANEEDNEVVRDDLFRAIEQMRIRFASSTQVKSQSIELGQLVQTAASDQTANLSLQSPASLFGRLGSITPTLGGTEKQDSTNTLNRKQELDQRSTYIDSLGDFFRITQRGMKSANVAGLYQEKIHLHIPAAYDQVRILTIKPNAKSANDPAPQPSQASQSSQSPQASQRQQSSQTQQSPEPDQYELVELNQPLYSKVTALTFSVAAAREDTGLAYNSKDSFGLDDPDDAALVVCVTNPQTITFWEWDRTFSELTAGDISADEKNPEASLYIALVERSSSKPQTEFEPLRISGFNSNQCNALLDTIRNGIANTPKKTFVGKDGKRLVALSQFADAADKAVVFEVALPSDSVPDAAGTNQGIVAPSP